MPGAGHGILLGWPVAALRVLWPPLGAPLEHPFIL